MELRAWIGEKNKIVYDPFPPLTYTYYKGKLYHVQHQVQIISVGSRNHKKAYIYLPTFSDYGNSEEFSYFKTVWLCQVLYILYLYLGTYFKQYMECLCYINLKKISFYRLGSLKLENSTKFKLNINLTHFLSWLMKI